MVNEVAAIKNKRNNKFIFYTLIIFKFGIVTLLLLSIKSSSENIYKLNSNILSIDKLKKYNFHTIRTSVVPDEVLHEKLDQLVDSLEDRHVYNYSSAEDMTDIIELQDYQSNGKLSEHDDFDFVSISPNVLELLHVLDEKGNKIEASQIDPKADTLLVPIHRKNDIKMILNYFQFKEEPKIMYIKNGQVNNDILWPGYYIYDSIYYIHQLQKTLYLNSGEVLLDKESAEMIEQELAHLGIDTYSIVVDSQNQEYNTLKANLQLDLFESLFHMIINLLSFLLCVVSIVIIFLELRKKEFGVYKLIGKYPIKVIGKFVILNGVITIGVALVVNPMFLFLLLIEGTIYGVFIYKYMRNKAILALKGE